MAPISPVTGPTSVLQKHVSYLPKATLGMMFPAIILVLEIDLPTVVPTLKSTTLSVVRSKQGDGKVYERYTE